MNDALSAFLNWLFSIVGNYGLVMVVFTLLLRGLLSPLDIRSRASARKMQSIQPRVNEINKKYANDPQKRMQKTRELYKKENYSMWGGCLPSLIQIPLLIILFGALRAFADMVFNTPLMSLLEQRDYVGITNLFSNAQFLWVQNIFGPDTIFGSFNQAFPIGQNLIRLSSGGVPKVFYIGLDAIPSIAGGFTGAAGSAASAGAWLGANGYEFSQGFNVARSVLFESNALSNNIMNLTNGFFLLPLMAGGAQFIQSKLQNGKASLSSDNPQAGMTKNMMYIFPAISVFIGATHSAMFMVYWTVSSLFAIALQLIIDWRYKKNDVNNSLNKA